MDSKGRARYLSKEELSPGILDAVIGSWRAEGWVGAVVTFAGVVRADRIAAGVVSSIEFTAHEQMAETAIGELIHRVVAESSGDGSEVNGDVRVHLQHALGTVPVGGCPIVIAVGTGHRKRAFRICEAVLEALKHEVPIWGRELTDNGSQWKVNH